MFLTLIIFYVYPLRFLMLFLTGFFFDLNGKIVIDYVWVAGLSTSGLPLLRFTQCFFSFT
jgi:hypothetical protein